ncbi:MAG TPA: ANTAR domain-containing protein [Methylomirabilota bacterium]|nr:ANTAR domain-containing protein [Methylomirabilota bacterium]
MSRVSGIGELDELRRENAELRRSLEERKLIERAKGLLMEWEGCSEREAFRRIRKTSMDTRTPMVEIARAILLSEQIRNPGSPAGEAMSGA